MRQPGQGALVAVRTAERANEIALRANTHSWVAVVIATIGLGVPTAAFFYG